MKKDLIPFTPQGLERPVALVSPNASQLVLDVLNNSWDKSSSGLGSHIYMDSESITDPDELQEYWEEYSVWAEDQILLFWLLLNESSSYLIMSSRLFDALDKRFDDIEEVKDVAKHGCEGGVSGFIYYYETRKFFFEHEDEIEDYLSNIYGDSLLQDLAKKNKSINQMINQMVWIVVQDYCTCKEGKHFASTLSAWWS